MTLIAIKHIFGERWKWFLDEESCFETLVALRQVFGASEQVAYNIALFFPESYRPRVIKRWRALGELDQNKFVHDTEMRHHDWDTFVEYWSNVNMTKPTTYARASDQAIASILIDHKADLSDTLLQARLRLHMWFFWRLNVRAHHITVNENLADGRVTVKVYDDLAHDPITIFHEVPSYG